MGLGKPSAAFLPVRLQAQGEPTPRSAAAQLQVQHTQRLIDQARAEQRVRSSVLERGARKFDGVLEMFVGTLLEGASVSWEVPSLAFGHGKCVALLLLTSGWLAVPEVLRSEFMAVLRVCSKHFQHTLSGLRIP